MQKQRLTENLSCLGIYFAFFHYWVYSSFTEKVQHNWVTLFKLCKFSLTPEVVFLLNCPDAGNYPDPNGKDNQKRIDKWKIKLHWQGKLLSRLAQVPSNKIANLHISVLDENNPFQIYIKVAGRNAYLVPLFFILNHESYNMSQMIWVIDSSIVELFWNCPELEDDFSQHRLDNWLATP